MGLFSTEEVIILKETSEEEKYLKQLELLRSQANGKYIQEIEKEIALTRAGICGENNILFELKNSGMNMVILHDIYLETSTGLKAQIDFLVLTPKLNFVIECKNLLGNIEIDSKGNFIRTFMCGSVKYKEEIYSPITQNQRHLQVLKEYKGEQQGFLKKVISNYYFADFFKGFVVLANPKTLIDDRFAPKELKEQVIRADQLIGKIKQMNQDSKEAPLSLKELRQRGNWWLEQCKERQDHRIEKVREILNNESKKSKTQEQIKSTPETIKKCPRCGKNMVKREAKKGPHRGKIFWGCSGYPRCRYTEECSSIKG